MEKKLEDFLKYVMDVHTDRYGQLETSKTGDEYDMTVKRVVEEYLKEK
jgi:hypothetical protein